MNKKFNAFHKAESNFFSMVSLTQTEYSNLVAFATGVQGSGLNPAIVNRLDDSFSTNLSACKLFYSEQNVPWALVLPEYFYNEAVHSLIKEQNLDLTGKGVAMAVEIENIQFPASTTALTIKDMQNDLHTWSIPLIYGFESTPEATEVYTIRHASAVEVGASLYHFSGYIDDTVICSLSLSLCGENARIDDVSTMPAYQKQGFATALIFAALNHAKQLNIHTCFLEASDSGLSLYKRIGFNELFLNHYYELQQ